MCTCFIFFCVVFVMYFCFLLFLFLRFCCCGSILVSSVLRILRASRLKVFHDTKIFLLYAGLLSNSWVYRVLSSASVSRVGVHR